MSVVSVIWFVGLGSDISVKDQYPKSVMEKRKLLIPMLKKARDCDVKAVIIKDRIYIGDMLYKGGPVEAAIDHAKQAKHN